MHANGKTVFLALLLSLLASLVHADCINGIMAGTLTYTNNSKAEISYIAQTGGTRTGGITLSGNAITLKHNIRAYLAAPNCASSFQSNIFLPLYLLDRTLSFTADLGQVGCGCNAALYLVSMPAHNHSGVPDPTKCGDYYCDANNVCGLFCPEMDVFEANNRALQITPHRCSAPQNHYYSSCDGGGCGQNVVHINRQAYGFGSEFTINTQNPFEVSMSFQTSGGNLNRINTVLSQNGKTFHVVHDDSKCAGGYLAAMTTALRDGMVVAMSYWGDAGSTMSWLDIPPCDVNQDCDTNTVVTFSNIQMK